MKHTFAKTLLAALLILALALGVAALAETAAEDAQSVDAADAAAPADAADAAEAQQDAQSTESSDSTALEEAFDAYYAARESSGMEDLQAELDEYVASGKLTQEQADLILGYWEERQALRDGVCPNCGYEFQSGSGYGRGGRMGKGGRGHGGRGGMGGMYGMRGMPQSYEAQPESFAVSGEALTL